MLFTVFLWQFSNLILILTVLLACIVMSRYTARSTNPVIAQMGNAGTTTIEGAIEAHSAGKNQRRLRTRRSQ